jgi:hypothetical protein
MLQIVHDIVPKAKLAFNSAFNGELAFAEGIRKLAEPIAGGGAEADLIVDDVGYFEEPFFQDGPVAAAIGEWLEREGGAAPASFSADALARILERGGDVERAIEQGKQIAARHEPDAMGAQWKPRPAAPSRAA